MTTKQNAPLALVIGATGGIGGAVAERLLQRGWRVRALHRNPAMARKTSRLSGLEWVQGDAMVEADVVAAAQGVRLVMHGANPPAYRNWANLQLPMLSSAIAAAKAADARLVFPGTVYNYGPEAFPTLTEASPQTPKTRKGAIRVLMEQALARASEEGLRVLIVRFGDFFGPTPSPSSWLSQGLLKAGKPLSAVTYPGPLAIPHGWAYLPDAAATMVRLAEDEANLADFEAFHMKGHILSGVELIATLEQVVGRTLAANRLPWLAVRAVAPVNETFREMLEMRYLWETPVLLDNAKLVARLGSEPHTPGEAAFEAALAGLNVLPRQPSRAAA